MYTCDLRPNEARLMRRRCAGLGEGSVIIEGHLRGDRGIRLEKPALPMFGSNAAGFLQWLDDDGRRARTRSRKLTCLRAFAAYAVGRDPALAKSFIPCANCHSKAKRRQAS
ncbi:MAG: hypothetical protein LBU32_16885 [Clostridiales bacterium]|nr:hypothetical protein [Clostridiales bacterium]